MKRMIPFLCLLLLCGCAQKQVEKTLETTMVTEEMIPVTEAIIETVPPTTVPVDPIQELINGLSLEERVGQLFLARCDDSVALSDIQDYHLGGFVLFSADMEGQTLDSLRMKLATYQDTANIPLLIAVDEEGGTVTRVSKYSAFRDRPFSSPRSIFEKQGYEAVLETENEKSQLLATLGFNVNLGPVCDLTTNPKAFMYQRSFGQAPATTGRFVMDTVAIMENHDIGSVLKHFPGYGNNSDTHTGIAVDSRSLEELESNDLIPFQAGISAGCGAILVSHTIVEAMDAQFPASLSPAVHDYLRQEMNFSGVIMTDDLVMQAITNQYGAGEAAVLAVLAGNDLLCSTDYRTEYEAVLAAVMSGRIPFDTLNQAVYHVLQWKAQLGLI